MLINPDLIVLYTCHTFRIWYKSFYAYKYYAPIIRLLAICWKMIVTYNLQFLNNDYPEEGKVLQLLQCN